MKYPTQIEVLLADLASWKGSTASRDRKMFALDSLARQARELLNIYFASAPAAVPLVPLGTNRTRDGRDARVICIDAGAQCYPVVAEITNRSPVTHKIGYFTKTGEPCGANPDDVLVGHLPPEPPKPRELWIKKIMLMGALQPHEEAAMSLGEPADAEARGYKLFREVLP